MGGNSYYTLLNHGVMTVQEDVTVNNKGGYSSLFDNGYYSWKSKDGIDNPTLTIEGGKFNGGLNTIKNDDDAILNIAGGEFINYTQAAFPEPWFCYGHGVVSSKQILYIPFITVAVIQSMIWESWTSLTARSMVGLLL